MKYLAKKDHGLRKFFSKKELLYLVTKSLVSDLRLPIKYRFFFFSKLNNYKKYSKVRIVNRCLFSARGGGIVRDFRISRMFFRELANFGQLAGFMKSSW